MLKHSVAGAAALAAWLCAGAALAQSSFTETCSNYGFVYSGINGAIHATCLKPDGTPNDTTMVLTGIVTVKGVLTNLHSSVPSNFQSNCGSIGIFADGPYVTLTATCRVDGNQFLQSSIQLDNINNNDGNLVQGH